AIAAQETPTTTPNFSHRMTATHVKPAISRPARDPKRVSTLWVGANSPSRENTCENTQLHTALGRHLGLKAKGSTKWESTNTVDNLLSPEPTTMPTVATRRVTRALAAMTSYNTPREDGGMRGGSLMGFPPPGFLAFGENSRTMENDGGNVGAGVDPIQKEEAGTPFIVAYCRSLEARMQGRRAGRPLTPLWGTGTTDMYIWVRLGIIVNSRIIGALDLEALPAGLQQWGVRLGYVPRTPVKCTILWTRRNWPGY
ncbi:unnamed protein product, partial [Ectocarpus sp. 12 AP-2014]